MAAARAIIGLLLAVAFFAAAAEPAHAQYFRRPVSELNPKLMLIDEGQFLGARIDPETVLVDQDGREFRWGDKLAKPTLLVMSYYTCDGTCSAINATLADLLKDVKLAALGRDFNIVTLSFDRHDNLKTTAAFRKPLALAGTTADSWTFATFKNEADLKAQTEKIGFKFFWVPEDRIFVHPGAFLFFGSDGRLVRVLYQEEASARDVELAVLDARQGQFKPHELITFAISVCYSYSYHDGRYVMSIPVLIFVGSFVVGLATLFGSILLFKIEKRSKRTGDESHAQAV